jgi:hypothetical protein
MDRRSERRLLLFFAMALLLGTLLALIHPVGIAGFGH